MKKKFIYLINAFVLIASVACNQQHDNSKEQAINTDRIVCVAKQQTEILYALGAEKNLVGVDLSSTYPKEAQKLSNVGYHRLLSAEGIISLKPTVVFHDGNIAPEAAIDQLKKVGIPLKEFPKTNSIEETKNLISSMAALFHKEKTAEEVNKKLEEDMKQAEEKRKSFKDTIKVVLIHFGRQMNSYLVVGQKSSASKILEWAGAKNSIEATEGMKPISPEMIVKAQPDVILATDFGYDKMGGLEKFKELPGIALTPAGKNNKIFRVEEHDLIYIGPRTGQTVSNLIDLLHQ
jgi:iron complex transport system substrate-binding protein